MGFSSLYIGATGITAHSDQMQVIGNNLANVSTLGYRKSDMLFSNLMYEALGGVSYDTGVTQVSQQGLGVGVADVRILYMEGGRETTTTATDLAISGKGFFGLSASNSDDVYYSRAGSFRFDSNAYLVDPNGLRVQGYAVDRTTNTVSGTISDVILPYEDAVVDGQTIRVVQSDPRATSLATVVTNLDYAAADTITSSSNPFFAMLAAYDGTENFGGLSPAYTTSMEVYDEMGSTHALTLLFDPVATSTLSGAQPGYSYWEYLVTLPGDEDGSALYGTSSAGLIGAGTLAFNAQGNLVGQSAYAAPATGSRDLSTWSLTSFASGAPAYSLTYGSNGTAIGTAQTIGLDFGMTSTTGSWLSNGGTADAIGANAWNLTNMDSRFFDINATTNYNTGSATFLSTQDGYTSGYLQRVSVDQDGYVTGHFTNSQSELLYQIALYRFPSEDGLRHAGNNLFSASAASGEATLGSPGTEGRGLIEQNTLEMSNVDMAQEFANMIITQRGFQANTKVITTSDSLLNTTINIKR